MIKATFAARCFENEILMHLRLLKKTLKDVSLHDPIGTDKEGNEMTFAEDGYVIWPLVDNVAYVVPLFLIFTVTILKKRKREA